jgi:AraC-like DNA-binding protein
MKAVSQRFQNQTAVAAISLSGARAAYIGPGLDLEPHRNAVATIAIALDAPFHFSLMQGEHTRGTAEHRHATLIPPATPHHLVAHGPMVFVYLDALSDDYTMLKAAGLDVAAERIRATALSDLQSVGVEGLCELIGIPTRPAPDARIERVVRILDRHPQEITRAEDAARLADLSPSRFQFLFRNAVGMPFRRYRLWRRMAIVVQDLAKGRALTGAALDAGFASSAHFSATFKAMFGLPPSRLAALGAALSVSH